MFGFLEFIVLSMSKTMSWPLRKHPFLQNWSILLKHCPRISPSPPDILGSPWLSLFGWCLHTGAASALYWLGRSAVGLISKQLAVDGGRPLARARDCPAARYGAHAFPHPAGTAEAKRGQQQQRQRQRRQWQLRQRQRRQRQRRQRQQRQRKWRQL